MDRTTRCQQLARLTDNELDELVRLLSLERELVTVMSGPSIGMIMSRVLEDARGEVFNLGEVLVTECQVRVGRSEGWAMLLGSRPDATRHAATIDATIAHHPQAAERIDARIAELIRHHDDKRAAQRAELAPTRVRFDTQ